jgi:hypothetical protein
LPSVEGKKTRREIATPAKTKALLSATTVFKKTHINESL